MSRILVSIAALLACLTGCTQPNKYDPPPPPAVNVAKPVIRTVTNFLEETGTTEAVDRVEIRARVSGFLDKIHFEDGQDVDVDTPLYSIQPREYVAAKASAKAALESMKVSLALAEIELKRHEELLVKRAVSQSEFDTVKAERDAAIAARDAAAARLDQAELNLEYCDIKSPISGRVERTLVKRGNLVGEQEATLLTTVVAYDPIHVYFNISERALLQATSRRSGKPEPREISEIKTFVGRDAIDEDFPFEGHLDYADLGVDESMGTYQIRAVFPNSEFALFPGLFVRVRVPIGTIENAVLIPERALAFDQSGRYVLVVGEDDIVERRIVHVGMKEGGLVVVTEGLEGDETVVIDGIQRARPGAKVNPTAVEIEPTQAGDTTGAPAGDQNENTSSGQAESSSG